MSTKGRSEILAGLEVKMGQWFVVYCRTGLETRALTNLKRQEYNGWVPLYRKTRRHARKTEKVLRPLFPRYLFINFDLSSQPWRPILSTSGVYTIVSNSEGPIAISDDVISGLLNRADAEGIFEVNLNMPKPGDLVRIESGPMADLEGIFQAKHDSDRVMLLLKLMGREVRVSVEANEVERL